MHALMTVCRIPFPVFFWCALLCVSALVATAGYAYAAS